MEKEEKIRMRTMTEVYYQWVCPKCGELNTKSDEPDYLDPLECESCSKKFEQWEID